jgi:hypothetical protein
MVDGTAPITLSSASARAVPPTTFFTDAEELVTNEEKR